MSDHHPHQRNPSIVTTGTDNVEFSGFRGFILAEERRMYGHAATGEKPCGPYPEGHVYEMFETDYTTWKAWSKKIDPRTADSVIVLKDPPADWSAPELSGYLLKEGVAKEEPAAAGSNEWRTILKLIPRPATAYMTSEEFWQQQVKPGASYDGYCLVTRHGWRSLNLKTITDWVMSVNEQDAPLEDNMEGLEQEYQERLEQVWGPLEPVDQELERSEEDPERLPERLERNY